MISQAYVFIDLPQENDPVLAGLVATDGSTGRFVYGKHYLQRVDAIALDPVNFPLISSEFRVEGNQGVPAVLLDAGPDNWGRKLMHVLHRQQPTNKLEELLATRGAGVGALRFSLSRTMPKERPSFPSLNQLKAIQDDIASLIASGQLPAELERLFEPGSSMGGARPKAVIEDEKSRLWIAKFNRTDDLVDQAKAEQMCYLMMRDAGIDCCNTRLERIAGRSVILIERFDLYKNSARRHFISSHALLYQPRVKADDAAFTFSYPRLADVVSRITVDAHLQKQELYRRMVFNVCVGNTDDHLRNHGFLWASGADQYTLAPAYDVVPQPTQVEMHAIALGSEGRQISYQNLLSAHSRFGLSLAEAKMCIHKIRSVVSEWRSYAERVGLERQDQAILNKCFNKLS